MARSSSCTRYCTIRGLQAVGAYSRFGWHHPGPALFYLLAPFYLLGGSTEVALSAGAISINLISLLAVAWALFRASATPALGIAMLVTIGLSRRPRAPSPCQHVESSHLGLPVHGVCRGLCNSWGW